MNSEKYIAYIPCSRIDQNTERQLTSVLDSMDNVFTDGCFGKDVKRPQLQACLN